MIAYFLVAFLIAWYLVVKWRMRHMTRLAEQLKSSMMSPPVLGHAYMLLGNAETTMKGLQRCFRDAIECGGTVAHWFTNKLYISYFQRTMPRIYKRKEGVEKPVNSIKLKQAVEHVLKGNTIKGTAKSFDLNIMTLKRYVRKRQENEEISYKPDYAQAKVFTTTEEELLAAYLQKDVI